MSRYVAWVRGRVFSPSSLIHSPIGAAFGTKRKKGHATEGKEEKRGGLIAPEKAPKAGEDVYYFFGELRQCA